ncbi:MAG: chromate transporter [Firmicutes bacterium]|nr:chromate transporter [Bacillota bacterium]
MKNNKYLQLFTTFFKIGATTFGGGYAMLPLIKREVVAGQGWLGDEEFLDVLAVAQSLPGAVAVNTAIFIGHKVGGASGAIIAMLGAVLPSFLVILAIAMFFAHFAENKIVAAAFGGIRLAVAALIAAAVLKLGRTVFKQKQSIILWGIFFILAVVFKLHAMLLIAAGAAAGLLLHSRQGGKTNKGDTP